MISAAVFRVDLGGDTCLLTQRRHPPERRAHLCHVGSRRHGDLNLDGVEGAIGCTSDPHGGNVQRSRRQPLDGEVLFQVGQHLGQRLAGSLAHVRQSSGKRGGGGPGADVIGARDHHP